MAQRDSRGRFVGGGGGGVKETGSRPELPRGSIEVTVGIHSDDAQHTHGTGEGLTIGDIGAFHEFGTQTVPQRSFIRGWFDERQDFIAETLRKQLAQVAAGKRPIEQAAERIALAFEGDVKARIARNIPPPLAPATIKAKGSSVTLIDTGQVRASIRGRVSVGKK
jgi:hypothetical protein